jgi:hypothetical protein
MAVVVLDVRAQDAKKLATPGDQEMVQALPAYRADPALGNGVGVRRLDRRAFQVTDPNGIIVQLVDWNASTSHLR